MRRVDIAVELVRAFFIAMLAVGVYLISATVPISSPLGLGEIRVFLVCFASALIVYATFKLIKYAALLEENPDAKKGTN